MSKKKKQQGENKTHRCLPKIGRQKQTNSKKMVYYKFPLINSHFSFAKNV